MLGKAFMCRILHFGQVVRKMLRNENESQLLPFSHKPKGPTCISDMLQPKPQQVVTGFQPEQQQLQQQQQAPHYRLI